MDFKSTLPMYLIGGALVLFVIAQSLFFLIKAWKRGKQLGITSHTLRGTVSTSAMFTIAPAIAILATIISLAGSLGLVLPWVRLSVIGNITYEATAAQATMDALHHVGGMAVEVTDKKIFASIAWVMTVGSVFPLLLLPIVTKPIQKKLNSAVSKSKSNLPDILAAAAFIGLIGAFIARAVAGKGVDTVIGDGAGVLSVITLVSAVVFSLVLEFICKRFKLQWLQTFVMPLSMILAMGIAVLAFNLLPEDIALLEWRG
ncbi:MAG TPA: DUF5058 domain-containing protein [Ruminococcaceae bacterium]|nr:DUF5058 domain-containing protein [Oscillospiraceae bacterium]